MRIAVKPVVPLEAMVLLPIPLALAVASVACNSPTAPSAVAVEIVGPVSVAPGESQGFTAVLHQANGESLVVTDQAMWTTENPELAAPSASTPGLVTGLIAGETILRAQYENVAGGKTILVLPHGTFRMRGHVTDQGVPVWPAVVEVASGPYAGVFDVTDPSGAFALYGVPSEAEIRVSRDGYEPLVQRVMLVNNDDPVDFALTPDFPRPDLSGAYTLTISADPACARDLPAAARVRTYDAVLEQRGPQIDVTLGGGDFIIAQGRGNGFSIHVSRDQLTADLQALSNSNFYYYYDYYYGPSSVLERLDSGTAYSPSGAAELGSVPSGLSGSLEGDVSVFMGVDGFSNFELVAKCHSDRHQLTLER